MELKARDLIAAGWHEGRRLGAVLRRARDLEATGLARPDVLSALEAEFPKQLPVILPRYEPAPLAEAIEAENPQEAANVASARSRMTELLHVPVVKRGVIMPDACPAGSARATIPVGGGIEVGNAIIPGAHSADIWTTSSAWVGPFNGSAALARTSATYPGAYCERQDTFTRQR